MEVTYTHHDNFISVYTLRPAAERNYALRIHFINGFASDLGWGSYLKNPTDMTIRKYPCYLEGTIIDKTNPDNNKVGYSNCELVFKDKENTYL